MAKETKLKDFKVETFDEGGYFTFITSAKNNKMALENLINNSTDYKNIVNKNKTLTIKVIEIKDKKENEEDASPWFNLIPGKCIYKGKTWRILDIDMQGGYFTLHRWTGKYKVGRITPGNLLKNVDMDKCKPV